MKFIDNLSVRTKLVLLYVLCVLIPMIITNWIIISLISSNIYSQQLKSVENAYDKSYIQLEEGINGCIKLMNIVSSETNTKFNDALSKQYEGTDEYFDTFNGFLRDYFSLYSFAFPQIEQTNIFVENQTFVNGGNYFRIDDSVRYSAWYVSTVDNDPKLVYMIKDSIKGSKTLSLVKNNTYLKQTSRKGYIIKVDLDLEFFNNILIREFNDAWVYIVDEKGSVILSNDSAVNRASNFILMSDISLKENMTHIIKKTANMTNGANWDVVIQVPEKKILTLNNFKSAKTNFTLILLNLLLPTVSIILISKSLNSRLKLITSYIRKVDKQSFELIEHRPARDEIGQLMDAFNSMVNKIRQLINDVYEVSIQKKNIEIQKRQAEINALQSQINPHFLFNCLGSIKMRSLMKGEKETAQVINNLANLFRISLSWERDMITVKEEITFVRNYLEIEKYRLGDGLKYNIFVDGHAENCRLPKMALTTFVENACVHGIENSEGDGLVTVEVLFFGEYIQCSISDNGIGMSEEQIQDIKEYLKKQNEMKSNVGIKNVIMRLSLCFGDKLEYNIFSNPNQGVKILIKIPAVYSDTFLSA